MLLHALLATTITTPDPAGASSTGSTGFTEANILQTYVTMESLLFAGLSAAIALSASSVWGRVNAVEPAWVARFTAGLLLLIAAGAVLAWTDLFGGHNWPDGWNRRLEAIGILAGIVAQPLIALAISLNLKPPAKHLE